MGRKGETTLYYIQREIKEWQTRQFGEISIDTQIRKLTEEVGELAKSAAGANIGHPSQVDIDKAYDAIGDVMVVLLGIAEHLEVSAYGCIVNVWKDVRRRDYKKYPGTGRPPMEVK